MGKLRKKPAKLVEQAEQASPVEPNKTNKTGKKSKPSDAPITASELKELMTAEVGCLKLVSQCLSDIKALLEEIRYNQQKCPLPSLNDRWDKNTTPQPPAKYWGDPPGRPHWPTDPWGNPAPYAVYCGVGEGPQCQHR